MPKTSRQRRKMKMNQNQDAIKEYNQLVKERAPKSNLLQDCFRAFWVGGTICCIGQCIAVIMMNYAGASKDDASTWSSIILILIGSVLTGTGLYAKIGKYAGAGSLAANILGCQPYKHHDAHSQPPRHTLPHPFSFQRNGCESC